MSYLWKIRIHLGLSINMIRHLHDKLGISAKVLIRPSKERAARPWQRRKWTIGYTKTGRSTTQGSIVVTVATAIMVAALGERSPTETERGVARFLIVPRHSRS